MNKVVSTVCLSIIVLTGPLPYSFCCPLGNESQKVIEFPYQKEVFIDRTDYDELEILYKSWLSQLTTTDSYQYYSSRLDAKSVNLINKTEFSNSLIRYISNGSYKPKTSSLKELKYRVNLHRKIWARTQSSVMTPMEIVIFINELQRGVERLITAYFQVRQSKKGKVKLADLSKHGAKLEIGLDSDDSPGVSEICNADYNNLGRLWSSEIYRKGYVQKIVNTLNLKTALIQNVRILLIEIPVGHFERKRIFKEYQKSGAHFYPSKSVYIELFNLAKESNKNKSTRDIQIITIKAYRVCKQNFSELLSLYFEYKSSLRIKSKSNEYETSEDLRKRLVDRCGEIEVSNIDKSLHSELH